MHYKSQKGGGKEAKKNPTDFTAVEATGTPVWLDTLDRIKHDQCTPFCKIHCEFKVEDEDSEINSGSDKWYIFWEISSVIMWAPGTKDLLHFSLPEGSNLVSLHKNIWGKKRNCNT